MPDSQQPSAAAQAAIGVIGRLSEEDRQAVAAHLKSAPKPAPKSAPTPAPTSKPEKAKPSARLAEKLEMYCEEYGETLKERQQKSLDTGLPKRARVPFPQKWRERLCKFDDWKLRLQKIEWGFRDFVHEDDIPYVTEPLDITASQDKDTGSRREPTLKSQFKSSKGRKSKVTEPETPSPPLLDSAKEYPDYPSPAPMVLFPSKQLVPARPNGDLAVLPSSYRAPLSAPTCTVKRGADHIPYPYLVSAEDVKDRIDDLDYGAYGEGLLSLTKLGLPYQLTRLVPLCYGWHWTKKGCPLPQHCRLWHGQPTKHFVEFLTTNCFCPEGNVHWMLFCIRHSMVVHKQGSKTPCFVPRLNANGALVLRPTLGELKKLHAEKYPTDIRFNSKPPTKTTGQSAQHLRGSRPLAPAPRAPQSTSSAPKPTSSNAQSASGLSADTNAKVVDNPGLATLEEQKATTVRWHSSIQASGEATLEQQSKAAAAEHERMKRESSSIFEETYTSPAGEVTVIQRALGGPPAEESIDSFDEWAAAVLSEMRNSKPPPLGS